MIWRISTSSLDKGSIHTGPNNHSNPGLFLRQSLGDPAARLLFALFSEAHSYEKKPPLTGARKFS
jgi:hypothetical protein